MAEIKHVGRVKETGRKCIVVFRTLPGDAYNCLVVMTESLPDSYHDAIINLVETNAAQMANEFAEVLARATFPDGSTMLPSLHVKKMLVRLATDQVDMTPNNKVTVNLAELNQIIAEQQGVSVQDLAIKAPGADPNVREVATVNDISPKNTDTRPLIDQQADRPLSDADLAAKYRADAARLVAEAAELQRMAEGLIPAVNPEPVEAVKAEATAEPVSETALAVAVEAKLSTRTTELEQMVAKAKPAKKTLSRNGVV
jgi:hypothetical protein